MRPAASGFPSSGLSTSIEKAGVRFVPTVARTWAWCTGSETMSSSEVRSRSQLPEELAGSRARQLEDGEAADVGEHERRPELPQLGEHRLVVDARHRLHLVHDQECPAPLLGRQLSLPADHGFDEVEDGGPDQRGDIAPGSALRRRDEQHAEPFRVPCCPDCHAQIVNNLLARFSAGHVRHAILVLPADHNAPWWGSYAGWPVCLLATHSGIDDAAVGSVGRPVDAMCGSCRSMDHRLRCTSLRALGAYSSRTENRPLSLRPKTSGK